MHIVCFPKHTIVLRQEEISKNVYFILKGLVHGYYCESDGSEMTKCFSAEGDFFSTEGFRKGGGSSFYIETLEECTCIILPYIFLHRIIKENSDIHIAILKLFCEEIERLEVQSRQMLLLDAKERYLAFKKAYPKLIDRVKKQYIASYIGIKPGSLSRTIKSMKY